MYCKSCGHQIEDDSRFCTKCGTSTQASSTPASSHPLSPAEPVCPSCGRLDSVTKVSALIANNTFAGGSTELASTLKGLQQKLLSRSPETILDATRHTMEPGPDYRKQGLQFLAWQAEVKMRASSYYLAYSAYSRLFPQLFYCGRCDIAFVQGPKGCISLGPVSKDMDIDLDISPELHPDANIPQGYDVCEIEACVAAKSGGLLTSANVYFVIMALGSRGYYVVAQADWRDGCQSCMAATAGPFGADNHMKWKSTPAWHCQKCKQKHAKMVSLLTASGWQEIDDKGPDWWQVRHVRKSQP